MTQVKAKLEQRPVSNNENSNSYTAGEATNQTEIKDEAELQSKASLTTSKLYPKTFHVLFGKYVGNYLNELDTYYHDFHCQSDFLQLNQKQLNETYPLVRNKSLLESRFHDYILYQLAQLTINKRLNTVSDQPYFDNPLINPTITCTRFKPANQKLDIVVFDSKMNKLTSFNYDKQNMISFTFNENNDETNTKHFLNSINDYMYLTDKSYKEFAHLVYGAIHDYQNNISHKKAANHDDKKYYPHSYLDINTISNPLQIMPEKMLDYIQARIIVAISNIGSFDNETTQISYDSGMSMLQAFFDAKEEATSKTVTSNKSIIKIGKFLSEFRNHFVDERLKKHLPFLEEKFSDGIEFKLDKVIVFKKNLTHNWIPKPNFVDKSLDSLDSLDNDEANLKNKNKKKKMKP